MTLLSQKMGLIQSFPNAFQAIDGLDHPSIFGAILSVGVVHSVIGTEFEIRRNSETLSTLLEHCDTAIRYPQNYVQWIRSPEGAEQERLQSFAHELGIRLE